MSTIRGVPPLDPIAAAPLRSFVQDLGGQLPRLTRDGLEAARSVEFMTRDALLAGRPFTEHGLMIDGPAGELALSVFSMQGHTGDAPGIYWIPGGGMIMGSRFAAAEALDAAVAVGAVVLSIEYRRAPEHPAPAPGDDCLAGLVWLAEHSGEVGVDPDRVVIAGASAGGGLAAATALRARDLGAPALAGLLLSCPMLDDRMISASANQFGDDLLWTRANNEFGWRCLLGERTGTDDVSIYEAPGRATDLTGLPPAYIDVGSVDLFRDEDVAFASTIWASGGDCELHVWAGGYHGFELLAPTSALAADASAARRRWLSRVLASPDG